MNAARSRTGGTIADHHTATDTHHRDPNPWTDERSWAGGPGDAEKYAKDTTLPGIKTLKSTKLLDKKILSRRDKDHANSNLCPSQNATMNTIRKGICGVDPL